MCPRHSLPKKNYAGDLRAPLSGASNALSKTDRNRGNESVADTIKEQMCYNLGEPMFQQNQIQLPMLCRRSAVLLHYRKRLSVV